MAVAPYKWTLDRYHHAVNAGVFADQAVELLKGEIVLMAPEGVPHAASSSNAGDYLRELLGHRAKVREGHPITLPNDSEPEPNIAVVDPDATIYRLHHPYPENIFWIIEFSNSSLQKDLEIKSTVYAEVGIAEYWVMNLRTLELIVFRDPVNGEYRSQVTLTQGDIRPLAFPDVCVSVQRLLG
jgi:Uma2 family endonuclease